jgi:hypothetical protein
VAYPSLKNNLTKYCNANGNKWKSLSTLVANLSNTMSDAVFAKYTYIEAYGYLQKLLDKKEINNFEVVKADDGSLDYTYFTTGPNKVDTLVKRMERLQADAKKYGSQVLYVMTPDKYITGRTEFERGIPYNYANETADTFLTDLKNKGINTLDFRELMKEDGKYTEDSFYKTDHHWKVQTAFWAFTKICRCAGK